MIVRRIAVLAFLILGCAGGDLAPPAPDVAEAPVRSGPPTREELIRGDDLVPLDLPPPGPTDGFQTITIDYSSWRVPKGWNGDAKVSGSIRFKSEAMPGVKLVLANTYMQAFEGRDIISRLDNARGTAGRKAVSEKVIGLDHGVLLWAPAWDAGYQTFSWDAYWGYSPETNYLYNTSTAVTFPDGKDTPELRQFFSTVMSSLVINPY